MCEFTKKIRVRGKEVPVTQLMSWQHYQLSDKQHSDVIKALAAIKEFQPITSRKLSNITGLERSNITRVLKDLENDGIIHVSKIAKCPTTNRHVGWYAIDDRPEVIEEPSLFD